MSNRWEIYTSRTLIGFGIIFYLFLFPHSIGGDGYVRYESLMHLLQTGELRPMLYSYVGPVFSIPLHYLGMVVKTPFWWLSRFNTFIFLGTVFLLWRFFREEWKAPQARLFVILLMCASMFPKHISDYYSEVFCACSAALAIACFLRSRFLLGVALLCVSVWNGPGTIIGGALVLAYFAWRERRWRYLVAAPLLPAGIFLENFLKFGSISSHAYMNAVGDKSLLPYAEGPGFTYPLFFGVLSVLFSFGKGLAFFTPGLFSVFIPETFRAQRAGLFLQAGAAYIVGLILVYARWWAWTGDAYWGPRFYLFASLWAPVALTVIWPTIQQSASRLYFWVIATGLSIWVGCQGVLYGNDFLENCHSHPINVAFMCHYVPEFSALWRVFAVWPMPVGRKVAYLAYFLLIFGFVMWRPTLRAAMVAGSWLKGELRRLSQLKEWKI